MAFGLFAGIGVALLAVGYWLGDNDVDVRRADTDRAEQTEEVDGTESHPQTEEAEALTPAFDQEP